MSLMIMSIGIVLVATLFPVSTMRALEANRATNSTIARHVADALTDIDPQFIHNPDGVFLYFPGSGMPPPPAGAIDSTLYDSVRDVHIASPPSLWPYPTFRGQNYVVDPLGWQMFNQDSPSGSAWCPPRPDALSSPRDYFGNPASAVTLPLPRRYTGASLFSPVNPYPDPTIPSQIQAAVVRAYQLVTQPDNWKLVTEGQQISGPTTTGIVSVALDGAADLSSVIGEDVNDNGLLDPGEDLNGNVVLDVKPGNRVIIFDADGTHSEVRTVTAVRLSTPTVSWAEPLPVHFDGPNIGKVRVEVADEIYTWMLSVRKRSNGSTNVDVVVFFKRAITDLQEQVYEAVFQPNLDNRVTVNFPAPVTEPVLKRGGYIFDTANSLWYRIAKIENETGYSADLLLDESIKQANYLDANGNGIWNAGEFRGGAILHPQVVNVFPLQSKEP